MRTRWLIAILLGIAPIRTVSACSRPSDRPIAELNGMIIRERDFQRYVKNAYSAEQLGRIRADAERRRVALDEYLDAVVVAAKTHKLGIDKEPRFKKAVELLDLKILSHLLTERNRSWLVAATQVSAADLRRYYDQHKEDYLVPPSFTARQLLIYVRGNPAFPDKGRNDTEALAEAKAALRRLRGGASWDVVAKSCSDDVGTNNKGGLIRDGRFGYFAPEVEQAVRTQPLGQLGEVVRSAFGYHVVQVESRVLDARPEPFEKLEHRLADRLAEAHTADARKVFIDPIAREVGLKLADAAQRDVPLLDEDAVGPDEVLAEIAGKTVRESDFRWFLKDALIPDQRPAAYTKPHARRDMLASFLDMLVLAAKARKEGIDHTPEFVSQQLAMEQQLLLEFLQKQDKAGPFCECGDAPEAQQESRKRYLASVCAEMHLRVFDDQQEHLGAQD